MAALLKAHLLQGPVAFSFYGCSCVFFTITTWGRQIVKFNVFVWQSFYLILGLNQHVIHDLKFLVGNLLDIGEKEHICLHKGKTVGFFLARFDSLPLAVSERDALRRHFKVDGGRSGQGVGRQRLTDRLGDGLRPRQRLHVHRVDVENAACWK